MSILDSEISGVQDKSIAGDLVTARFGMSEDLVTQYDAAASDALAALAESNFSVPLGNLDLSASVLDPPDIGDAPIPDAVTPYESQAQPVDFPDITALRALLDLAEITVAQVTLPVLEAITPTVNIPDAPDTSLPEFPTDVPTVVDPTLPTSPTLDMPPVPILDDIVLPAIPTIDNIVFEGVLPTADLTPPEPMFAYTDPTYQSDLADAVKTKLYNDVILGGTGLTADVEQAIWDRALSRLNIELDKTYQQVLTNWSAWNCEMPDGVLSGALQEVMFEETRDRLDLDRDILYKQADLAQQNTQFAITSGMVYEKQIMDFTNQSNQLSFEAAKFRVQAVIDIFNLRVTSYTAQLDGYKTLAQVFESRIRAELSKVELYRAQMEGAKILGELQVQKVQIYTARVNALQVLIDLYRAQMEGAKLQVDVDKARLDVFRTRIDAVVAQISGVTASYNLYQAQISGETAKVDLYGKQVTAYATQVQSSKVVADISLAEAQANIEANKDKIAVLTAAIDKYKADTQYEVGKDEVGARVYTAQIGGYEAEVGREGEYMKAQIDTYRTQVTQLVAQSELAIKETDANLRAATALQEMQLEALKAAANILSQKVASALTSVSASAQVGFNASESESYSRADSLSDSYTTGKSAADDKVVQYIHHISE